MLIKFASRIAWSTVPIRNVTLQARDFNRPYHKGPFPLHSQIACDPLFKIRMRTFANRMRTFAMRFWPVRNVWFLANVRMRTIVPDWRQPIRKQLCETKRQRGQALSKRDRFHWLDKQLKFVRTTLKCVLNSHAFGIRNSEIACVLRIANEVEMGLKTVLISVPNFINFDNSFL